MHARITDPERKAPETNHGHGSAQHLANAKEWLRRLRAVTEADIANGVSKDALQAAFLSECKLANVDPASLSLT